MGSHSATDKSGNYFPGFISLFFLLLYDSKVARMSQRLRTLFTISISEVRTRSPLFPFYLWVEIELTENEWIRT